MGNNRHQRKYVLFACHHSQTAILTLPYVSTCMCWHSLLVGLKATILTQHSVCYAFQNKYLYVSFVPERLYCPLSGDCFFLKHLQPYFVRIHHYSLQASVISRLFYLIYSNYVQKLELVYSWN